MLILILVNWIGGNIGSLSVFFDLCNMWMPTCFLFGAYASLFRSNLATIVGIDKFQRGLIYLRSNYTRCFLDTTGCGEDINY